MKNTSIELLNIGFFAFSFSLCLLRKQESVKGNRSGPKRGRTIVNPYEINGVAFFMEKVQYDVSVFEATMPLHVSSDPTQYLSACQRHFGLSVNWSYGHSNALADKHRAGKPSYEIALIPQISARYLRDVPNDCMHN